MKKLKFLLFSTLFFTFACGNDDYSIEYIDSEVKQDFSVSLTIERDRVASNTQVDFTVSIESVLSVDAVVTIANINNCGNPISHLAESSTGTATIKAGETTGTGSIIASALNAEFSRDIAWDGLSDCATFNVTGIALSEGDDPYVASTSIATTTVTQFNADYMGEADDDAVKIAMDWKNPSENDFDMYVSNSDGSIFYEDAESGSRFEGDYFDNDTDAYYPAPDDSYIVWYTPFVQETADVPGEIYFTHPVTGKVDVVSFVSPNGTQASPTPVATITKTTDADGNMTYEIAAY